MSNFLCLCFSSKLALFYQFFTYCWVPSFDPVFYLYTIETLSSSIPYISKEKHNHTPSALYFFLLIQSNCFFIVSCLAPFNLIHMFAATMEVLEYNLLPLQATVHHGNCSSSCWDSVAECKVGLMMTHTHQLTIHTKLLLCVSDCNKRRASTDHVVVSTELVPMPPQMDQLQWHLSEQLLKLEVPPQH